MGVFQGQAVGVSIACFISGTVSRPGSGCQHCMFHQWECLKARQWASALHLSSVGLSQGQAVGVSTACFISGSVSRPGSGRQHCMFHQWKCFKVRQWASTFHVSSVGVFQGQAVASALHVSSVGVFQGQAVASALHVSSVGMFQGQAVASALHISSVGEF